MTTDGFKITNGILTRYDGNEAYVIIPNGVTQISNYVFEGCNNMQAVNIPDSVVRIGYKAFSQCRHLNQVLFGKRVQEIYPFAFEGCPNLTDIILPESVVLIGDSAFRDCTNLERIIIPEHVPAIGDDVFSGTKWLGSHQEEFVIMSHYLIAYHGRIRNPVLTVNMMDAFNPLVKPHEPLRSKEIIPDEVEHIDTSVCKVLYAANLTYQGVSFVPDAESAEINAVLELIRTWNFTRQDIKDTVRYDIICQLSKLYPNEKAPAEYLRASAPEIVRALIRDNMTGTVRTLLEVPDILKKDNIDPLIQYAINHQTYEIQVFLTDYKNKHIGYEDADEIIKRKFTL